ncbi:hypothetical protein HZS_464 [Henneguya salminicola]|nr:hypothetical protein HZS_464 [Henneguya salminicola]
MDSTEVLLLYPDNKGGTRSKRFSIRNNIWQRLLSSSASLLHDKKKILEEKKRLIKRIWIKLTEKDNLNRLGVTTGSNLGAS